MQDVSTTTISYGLAKQAYDNWNKEYIRCKEAFELADEVASKGIKVSKKWYRKEKTLKAWIESKCDSFWLTYDYMNMLDKLGKHPVYTNKEPVFLRNHYKCRSPSYEIKALLGGGNDIQASSQVMAFINKWKNK